MSKIPRHREFPLQNLVLRTDLGTKLRKALFEQHPIPQGLLNCDYSALKIVTHAAAVTAPKKKRQGWKP